MPTIVIGRGEDGRLDGITEPARKAYAKWKKIIKEIGVGESISFSYRVARSGPFHRRHFAMLNVVFENQEQFADEEMFRKWVEVGAGYCDLLPGPGGKMVAVPKSIKYEALDQTEFEEIHAKVFAFLRSQRACQFLWPDVGWQFSSDSVDRWLEDFYQ